MKYCYLTGFRDHSNFVNCVRFSPDGSKFLSVSSDKKGILFDGKSGEKIGELSSEDGHKGTIYAVSWSPNGKQVSILVGSKVETFFLCSWAQVLVDHILGLLFVVYLFPLKILNGFVFWNIWLFP